MDGVNALKWWQKTVFYQIYPRSFADGNGDGMGDFRGMTARLDYLRDLGIGAIWLSPHYPSPFFDCGYDISDYTNVAPEYGALDDFRRFLDGAHERGIRVILDLVLNHTSHLHPWFIESRSSRDNPRRDWYVWHDGLRTKDEGGGPPNNWDSVFGGPAWELDPATNQYYYHFFLKEQPDLNWRNPQVKSAMWDAVRFWLDMGVDGFRLDAIATIFEDPALPDHTAAMSVDELAREWALAKSDADSERLNKIFAQLIHFQVQQPGVHELMRELRALVDEFPGDRVLVGEDDDVTYHGTGDDELHMVFNFPLMRVGRLTPAHVRANQAVRLAALPPDAWPCNTLGNHDASRVWNRFGDGVHDAELARLHLAMLLTLKGTPFLYYGEEIGMTDLELTDLALFRDTPALNQYRVMTEELGVSSAEALKIVALTTRDRARTPMQWSDAPNAGFSPPGTGERGVQTWLPVHPNYAEGVNVAAQQDDPGSLLNFYKALLRLRASTPALVAGEYRPLLPESEPYLAFMRAEENGGQSCLVLLNFSAEEQTVRLDGISGEARLLFCSHPRQEGPFRLDMLSLAPFEILVAEPFETGTSEGK